MATTEWLFTDPLDIISIHCSCFDDNKVGDNFVNIYCRKKGSKTGSKEDKESVLKNAIANAHLWEGKLLASDRAKQDYRFVPKFRELFRIYMLSKISMVGWKMRSFGINAR